MQPYPNLYRSLLVIMLITLATSACTSPTATPAPTTPPARQGSCGDGVCAGPETSANCPADCPAAATATATPITATAPPPPTAIPQAEITLIVGVSAGEIRPLLGVNVGPLAAGEPGNADLITAYHTIGVTSIRTHDYYGPLDMATIYPDQNADPSNPASYDFAASDVLFAAIIENGFAPYLRIGDSWNNHAAFPRADPRQPTNPQHWMQAAIVVVQHYNDPALWGGQYLRYVEIWNEPNHQQFWDGAPNDFYRLFADTAIALKAAFPDLSIGGPGLAPAAALTPQGQSYTLEMLDYLQARAAPLDFFSWHLYSNDPEEYRAAANFYREQLDSHGYTHTESHITEWNTDERDTTPDAALALRTGARGAASLTAAWMALQDTGVAQSYFYRGNDTAPDLPTFYGLFFADGRPKKIALAFGLWSEFSRYPQRRAVAFTPESKGLWALAGQDAQGNVAILIANPTETGTIGQLAFEDGRSLADYTGAVHTVSDAHPTTVSAPFTATPISIAPYSVLLITLTQP